MASAAKFWPHGLFKLGGKKDAPTSFVPSTDMAARIVGGASPKAAAASVPEMEPAAAQPFDDAAESFDPAEGEVDLSRQSERFVPDKTSTTLTDKKGRVVRCRIINLSATGVAIEADFRVIPANTVAMVGAKPVKMGRSIRGGQVFVFDKPLDPARCHKQIIL